MLRKLYATDHDCCVILLPYTSWDSNTWRAHDRPRETTTCDSSLTDMLGGADWAHSCQCDNPEAECDRLFDNNATASSVAVQWQVCWCCKMAWDLVCLDSPVVEWMNVVKRGTKLPSTPSIHCHSDEPSVIALLLLLGLRLLTG
jgi:hypothetical protein